MSEAMSKEVNWDIGCVMTISSNALEI